ncbi:MAG TPA: sulfite exporter TauE/SafE family protein [Acidisoma sp.]|nr:sulfite exporter TauE/SafE family protein [Acidisoma sp.]
MSPLFAHALSGFFVGLLVGLTGVGGGSLMTPLLILLFGIHPATAVGSDLLYAATTKAVGTGVHGFRGSVDWRVVGRLAAGSAPMTILTILVCSALGLTHHNARFLNEALGLVLVMTACFVIFQAQVTRAFSRSLGAIGERQRAWLTVLIGAILGVTVTLTSVGAGAIGVTALIVLYPKLPPARLVGSDIAHAVPLTLLAGMGHWWLGDVNFDLVGSLLLGSIPGVILGSLWSTRMADRSLRVALAAVLLIIGFRLVS